MVATDAVQVLDVVGDNDIETLLGFPLLTKAEPYTAKAQVKLFIRLFITELSSVEELILHQVSIS